MHCSRLVVGSHLFGRVGNTGCHLPRSSIHIGFVIPSCRLTFTYNETNVIASVGQSEAPLTFNILCPAAATLY